MPIPRPTATPLDFNDEEQHCLLTTSFAHLVGGVTEIPNLSAEIDR